LKKKKTHLELFGGNGWFAMVGSAGEAAPDAVTVRAIMFSKLATALRNLGGMTALHLCLTSQHTKTASPTHHTSPLSASVTRYLRGEQSQQNAIKGKGA